MADVAVLGTGMTRFGIFPEITVFEMALEAGLEALQDANMTFQEIQAVYTGYTDGRSMLGVRAAKEFGLTGVPVHHVENASATGSVAFRDAYLAVASGLYDRVLVVAFDKMEETDFGRSLGQGKSVEGTILPAAFFAMWAQRRMYEYGTTVETLATIAAKNWNNAARNPKAQRQATRTITPEDILKARMMAEPLTTMMSAPVGGGAAAAVIARKELASHYTPGRKVVTVAASALQSERYRRGHVFLGPIVGPSQMTADTAREAYEKAGIGPEDLDLVEIHEAFPIEELLYSELLGICRPGEGDRLVADGETALTGRIPFSTAGGLIGRGHPGGPTGLAQIHEVTQQLRGDAGPRQIKRAQVGLAHMVGAGSVCCVHILKT